MNLSANLLSTVYLFVAAIGMIVAILGYRGENRGRARWCPRCDQDLSGTEARICSACGFSSPEEVDFQSPQRRWWIIITGLSVVSVASTLAVGWDPGRASRLFTPVWTPIEIRDLPIGWRVERSSSDDFEGTGFRERVRILHEKKVHFDWQGWSADLGFLDSRTARRVGLGTDLDRNGVPDLVIRMTEIAGTRSWVLFSLAGRDGVPRLQPAAVLTDGGFSDVDGDGHFEFVAEDSALRNQWSEPGRISVPSMVFSPASGGWRFDEMLSRGRPLRFDLTEDPLEPLTKARAQWAENRKPFVSSLFGAAFQLASRGRFVEADRLLGAAWPGDTDPNDVADFTTFFEASGNKRARSYVANAEARRRIFEDMLAASRFSDELATLRSTSPLED
ncbi:MAG: hypothetical protein CMJ23_13435 [Phycisphaerae bacterium]|nr:hypothetical protein [Phycisphaerae bacterium]